MHRFGAAAVLAAAGALSVCAPVAYADSGSGDVVVFRTEVSPVTVYENPAGCRKLPADSHVLVNRSDRPVTVYGDPFCLTPGLVVQPRHGAHVVPGSGSFSV